MKQLLEMILAQLQQLVTYVTEQLDKVQATEEDEKFIAIGKAFATEITNHKAVKALHLSHADSFAVTPEVVCNILEALECWEEELGDYDRDALKTVYDEVANVLSDPADEIEAFMSGLPDQKELWDRISEETDYDPDNSISDIIEALNNSICDDDKAQIRDAVDSIREITRNW